MNRSDLKTSHKIARGILLGSILVGVVVVLVLGAGYLTFEVMGRQAENAVGPFKPEMSDLENGVYYGEYKAFDAFTVAEVEFEIENGRLSKIEFDNLFITPGHSAGEEVRERITENGDLRFDTVTGATRTSSFAKAAIKDAIEKGPTIEYDAGLMDIDFK